MAVFRSTDLERACTTFGRARGSGGDRLTLAGLSEAWTWDVFEAGYEGRRSLGLEADAQELGIASNMFDRGPGLVLGR